MILLSWGIKYSIPKQFKATPRLFCCWWEGPDKQQRAGSSCLQCQWLQLHGGFSLVIGSTPTNNWDSCDKIYRCIVAKRLIADWLALLVPLVPRLVIFFEMVPFNTSTFICPEESICVCRTVHQCSQSIPVPICIGS